MSGMVAIEDMPRIEGILGMPVGLKVAYYFDPT
jgi:hypothetical protein